MSDETGRTAEAQPSLLSVRDLSKHFRLKAKGFGGRAPVVHAVDGLSFDVQAGETLGIVGESGCGKSTTSRLLMRLIEPTAGSIKLEGRSIGEDGLSVNGFRRRVQMVFQDSFASLNPRLRVENTIAFAPRMHGLGRGEALRRTHDLLSAVGLNPLQFGHRYPHELSGGQRQRVNIARALVLEPSLVILDEPVSALDKSVEAQVLNLLSDLKAKLGLTFIFISHDLDVVRFISTRVLVMYLGRLVEIAPAEVLFADPCHPYTRALLESRPSFDPTKRRTVAPLQGDPPNPIDPPSGCRFRTRCAWAEPVCTVCVPREVAASSPAHAVACLAYEPGSGHSRAA